MSVALATMDSAYGLRLGLTTTSRHHLHHLHPLIMMNNHLNSRQECSSPSPIERRNGVMESRDRQEEPSVESSLRFSMVNILRPDFGREAVLSTLKSLERQQAFSQARDLSLSGNLGRLSTQSPPMTSGLSRSTSLESLASNRSSLTGSSINGANSVCSSAASTVGGESVNSDGSASSGNSSSINSSNNGQVWPAWIYCTRYSDRPSSGPRSRRVKRQSTSKSTPEDKRPRTAFSSEQLSKLKREFEENPYLTEQRRQKLSNELGLNEAQIKIWFQNKRAKMKKSNGRERPLARQLMAQGLYNHSTVPVDENGEELLPNTA